MKKYHVLTWSNSWSWHEHAAIAPSACIRCRSSIWRRGRRWDAEKYSKRWKI